MRKIEEKKKKKREAMLNTAYDLFTKQGFQKTSISDIAKSAGVAKGTFYLYFRDKTAIRYSLISYKSAKLFHEAYQAMMEADVKGLEEQLVYIIDWVLDKLEKQPTLLEVISKHLGWGIFKHSLEEPVDQEQRNIYDLYMEMLENSGYEFKNPEVMLYMIIELVGGASYNSILEKQPVEIQELKPYLYDTIRLIIKSQKKNKIV